ncbi:hypothetical protein EON64_06050 [archaeon]|nr:MAG: hypothetical protein EON64_06050 [archaeon]
MDFARFDSNALFEKMLYNLYVYNRKGKCLYYREWSRPLNTLSDDPEEEKRLMYDFSIFLP